MHNPCISTGERVGLARRAFLSVSLALCTVQAGQVLAGSIVPDEDSQPPSGLVATFRDASEPMPVEVVRIEPTVAFWLKAGESPHPRLDPHAWSGRWQGQIQILRGGSYRFGAHVIGRLRVTIGGREVLSATGGRDRDEFVPGTELELAPGNHPIVVEFSKTAGPARVQLSWESPHFRREPLPWFVLSHRPENDPPQLAKSLLVDRGRFLVEELSCVACHRPGDTDAAAKSFVQRQGSDLSRIGERAYAGWIFAWLDAPQRFSRTAAMPQLFSDDTLGELERNAVATYLASLGGPLQPPNERPEPKERASIVNRGARLFGRVGCAVCHTALDGKMPFAELTRMGSKTTPERLARYLANPLAVHPSGRMPQMFLDGGEVRDLAYFLCESADENVSRELPDAPDAGAVFETLKKLARDDAELERFNRLPDDERLRMLGKRLLTAKSCTNCHRIAPDGEPLPASTSAADFAALHDPARMERGCLRIAADSSARVSAPRFRFSAEQRASLKAFLTEPATGASAPTVALEATLRRLHCVGCHARDGQGGLSPDLVEELRQFENAQDAESVSPPPLTGVGEKLRTAWLREVLVHGRRARPWMALRMPQFGEANVGHLPEALAAADGVAPSDAVREFPYDAEHIEAGRLLVGRKGFGCIACHDFAGRPNSGTRGPDLVSMNQRVRYDWYRRWMDDSQRIQPGTRMPTVFPNGTSSLKNLFAGSGDAQSDTIWEYLALGANLPPPEGLEPPKGLVLEPADRPLVVRTFMPDAGSRAFAVGFPHGVSFAFDATECRLAYGWTGSFLNAGPIWNDRGGNPAGVGGPRFWTAPPGFPWAFSESPDAPPNWTKQQADPAFGASLPEGQLPAEPPRLRFLGANISPDGRPTFRYSVDLTAHGNSNVAAEIREQFEPRQELSGVGVVRSHELRVPAGYTAWLRVAQVAEPPRLLDSRGEPIAWDVRPGVTDQPAAGRHVVVAQGSAGAQVVSLVAAPPDAAWVLQRERERWHVMLRTRIPAAAPAANDSHPGTVRTRVAIWSPYRNDPAMIHVLLKRPAQE